MTSGGYLVRNRVACQSRLVSIVLSSVLLGAGIIAFGGAGCSTAAAAAAAAAPAAGWASSPPPGTYGHDDHGCDDVFRGRAAGSLTKTTSAGPNGSSVLPGQTITVTLRWNPRDFGWRNPSLSEDCVMIGSRVSHSLSQVHEPGPNGGTDTFSYVVPDSTGGQPICDRGVLLSEGDGDGDGGGGDGWGDGSGGQHESWGTGPGQDDGWHWGDDGQAERSAVLCYTVQAAMTPEAPMAVLFPVAALAVGGGSLLVHRRRRRVRTER